MKVDAYQHRLMELAKLTPLEREVMIKVLINTSMDLGWTTFIQFTGKEKATLHRVVRKLKGATKAAWVGV